MFLAFLGPRNPLNAINRRNDIFYGISHYAWPIQKLLILYVPGITRMALTAVALPLAVAGYLSWHLVEKVAIGARSANGAGRLVSGSSAEHAPTPAAPRRL